MATARAFTVMPRSRSISKSSSTWSRNSRYGDRPTLQQELVGQRAFPVVDMGHDREVTNESRIHGQSVVFGLTTGLSFRTYEPGDGGRRGTAGPVRPAGHRVECPPGPPCPPIPHLRQPRTVPGTPWAAGRSKLIRFLRHTVGDGSVPGIKGEIQYRLAAHRSSRKCRAAGTTKPLNKL